MSVTYEALNASGAPITVAKGAGGFRVFLSYHRTDGKPLADILKRQVVVDYLRGYVRESLPPEWSMTRTEQIACPDEPPGTLEVDVVIQCLAKPPFEVYDYKQGRHVGDFVAWSGEVHSNAVKIAINEPAGLDRDAFQAFHGQPLSHPKELLKRYPTSNYAALVLWGQGLTWYSGGAMPEIGASRDFEARKIQEEVYRESPGSFRSWIGQVNSIVVPWEKLFREFPDFNSRPQLLFGLSRCYMHLGEQQKAVPLLQELLSKFPDSEPGKKAVAYRDVLKAHELWPE